MGGCPAATLYAFVSAALADWVAESFGSGSTWFAPVWVTQFAAGHAPKPVSDEVGDEPVSPEIVVAPALVMPEPASTANGPAVPSGTVVPAALVDPASAHDATTAIASTPIRAGYLKVFKWFLPVTSMVGDAEAPPSCVPTGCGGRIRESRRLGRDSYDGLAWERFRVSCSARDWCVTL